MPPYRCDMYRNHILQSKLSNRALCVTKEVYKSVNSQAMVPETYRRRGHIPELGGMFLGERRS